uniref:DUF362 domain-containing protein n=1 Tax=Ascaris lumbricoides TaxID=6252 RepID=A0A0M3HY37_ASCLU
MIGNLTKHILKHHKKEQDAYIGKDDIIIKKGKKSVKDPAAVDFLEKSMIVLTASPSENPLSLIQSKDVDISGKKLLSAFRKFWMMKARKTDRFLCHLVLTQVAWI